MLMRGTCFVRGKNIAGHTGAKRAAQKKRMAPGKFLKIFFILDYLGMAIFTNELHYAKGLHS
jgi:hypothetical protein